MVMLLIDQLPYGFLWITGILLSVIAFFLVNTYLKIDKIDTNVQQLMINDGSNQEWKKGTERRVRAIETKLPSFAEKKLSAD
ncbi:MAG: hypothetical protein Q8L07_04230 [Sediminibacterium sp.]|nr:hypothetical protein [Sediminibacterium sp.]